MAWQPADTAEVLKAAYQAEHDGPIRTRLHGLWLLRRGWHLGPVAQALGMHYRSVRHFTISAVEGRVLPR